MDWIQEIKSDANKALKQIYLNYRAECITWLIKNHNLSEQESKEIFQTSIVIFYDNVTTGKLERLNSDLKTYLFAICKNKCMELFRERKMSLGEKSLPLLKSYMKEGEHAKEKLENDIEQVVIALNRIGDPCRSILQLFYYKKFGMDIITQMMGYKNISVTKNLKYKCILRVRKYLSSNKISFNTNASI